MATKGKKALIIGGVLLGSFLIFGYRKFNSAKQVIEHLDFTIKDISKVKLGLSSISFDTVITLINPTAIDFGATASSYISLKEVRVYSPSGTFLGSAKTNIHKISLPSQSRVDLPKINFNLSSVKALKEFLNNSQLYLNQDFSQLKYQIDVDTFGSTLTLDA